MNTVADSYFMDGSEKDHLHQSMRFTTTGQNRVQSDQGFVFWMKNPFNLHYFEGLRELVVPGEMLTGDPELLVSTSTIKAWIPPDDQEGIEPSRRKEITANISAALDFLGVTH